ncbi:MAG: thiamine-phosphate kinase [Candidatus Krumholzibacteria bacterium]|nr:thiamine-phosphate kinase [Candidatus Krumholzibacteria bacterium]
MKELEVIDRLRKAFPGCGIGDDAAVIPSAEGDQLFAADASVEGVHFDLRFCTLSQAVQKLVTSNVSDVFAMGGRAGSIVFTAGLPAGCGAREVDGIIDGLKRSCAQYGVRLAGGDTVLSPGGFVFNVAILGEASSGRAVPRSGARAGDLVVLFGEIGLSLAGLGILSAICGGASGERAPVPRMHGLLESADTIEKMLGRLSIATSDAELHGMALSLGGVGRAEEILRFVRRHLVPLARPLEAAFIDADPPRVTAMIDVSDGLAKDLKTLCEESGAGAVIREEALPVPGAIGEIFGLEGSALVDFAISSGEEYVMLAAVSGLAGESLPTGATAIGTIGPAAGGIALVGDDGKKRPLPRLGYEHGF